MMKTHQESHSSPILVHGNFSRVSQITRKVIHKYVSADGTETQELTVEGSHQEMVHIEEGDAVSRVIKRTVLRSEGDQKEVRQCCVEIAQLSYVPKFSAAVLFYIYIASGAGSGKKKRKENQCQVKLEVCKLLLLLFIFALYTIHKHHVLLSTIVCGLLYWGLMGRLQADQ